MVSLFKNLATSTSTSATVIAPKGCEIQLDIINEPKDELPKLPEPAWAKMSIGKTMFGKYAGYPYEETLISLNANEAKVYKWLLDTYEYKTGLSTLNTQNMTSSDKITLTRGYTGLRQRNLVKRVKKFTYLINPEARIHHKLFESLLELWDNTP